MKRPIAGLVGCAAALLLQTSIVSAHDVWLTLAGEANARRVVINYGHPDDRPPAFADKVVDIVAISAGGITSLLNGLGQNTDSGVAVAETQPFADDGHALFAARYDNGYWVKTPEGLYRNATRRSAPNAVDSIWSVKFAKAVSGRDAPWQTTLGHDLEIVPLSDPAAAKPGDGLQVRVLFQGNPLAGADVERGDGSTIVAEEKIPRFKTDADGVATVPIVAVGPMLLVVDHRVTPSATPHQANADLFNATLWFAASPKPN